MNGIDLGSLVSSLSTALKDEVHNKGCGLDPSRNDLDLYSHTFLEFTEYLSLRWKSFKRCGLDL